MLAWAAGVTWLSSLSGDEIEKLNPWDISDKAAHFAAYAVGAILISFALRLSVSWSWRRVAVIGAATISIFGATDEWHQQYTPKRSGADVQDWIADTLGAIAGVWVASFLYARNQRKNHPAPTPN